MQLSAATCKNRLHFAAKRKLFSFRHIISGTQGLPDINLIFFVSSHLYHHTVFFFYSAALRFLLSAWWKGAMISSRG